MKKQAITVLLILAMLVSAAGCYSNGNPLKIDKTKKYSLADAEYKCLEYASFIAIIYSCKKIYNINKIMDWNNVAFVHFAFFVL